MELRQLEHFVAVAEERHFTHAAETLRISQSGLSASIRALELELGAALFIRTTRSVELTAARYDPAMASLRDAAEQSLRRGLDAAAETARWAAARVRPRNLTR